MQNKMTGAVIEVVEGGYIVAIMTGEMGSMFGPSDTIKKIFPKFRDAFDFLAKNLAPGENDADALDQIEKDFRRGRRDELPDDLDDEDPRDHPQFRGGDDLLG